MILTELSETLRELMGSGTSRDLKGPNGNSRNTMLPDGNSRDTMGPDGT